MINLRNRIKHFVASLLVTICIVGCLHSLTMRAYAKENSVAVRGNMYEFASNAHYEFSSVTASSGNAFGTFTISGDLKSISNKNGLPAYSCSSESVNFYYSYDQSKLNVQDTEWHLIDDKTKTVDVVSLDQNILSGAIIIQYSKDGVSWFTDVTMTDVFTGNDDLSNTIYATKSIQLENGCYYRVIVAYELQRKIGEGKILFVPTEEKEGKKVAEVYEFYVVSSEVAGNTTSAAATPRKELGQKINTGKDNGYSGNNAIDKDDPHYGWNLGTFVVNGYTREKAYVDDGIYMFTVKNLYTGETTTKTIYVGTDKYLLALSKNLLTVDDLNEKIMQNAAINDDGTIVDYVPPKESELPEPPIPEKSETQPVVVVDTTPDNEIFANNPAADVSAPVIDEVSQRSSSVLLVVVLIVVVVVGVFVVLAFMKRAKKKKERTEV